MKHTAELKLVEQEDVQIDMRELFRGAVRMTLESVLEETVLELCGAARGVRGRHLSTSTRVAIDSIVTRLH